MNKISLGWTFFTTNPEILLSDSQLTQLVNSYYNRSNNADNLKTYIAYILMRQKNGVYILYYKNIR